MAYIAGSLHQDIRQFSRFGSVHVLDDGAFAGRQIGESVIVGIVDTVSNYIPVYAVVSTLLLIHLLSRAVTLLRRRSPNTIFTTRLCDPLPQPALPLHFVACFSNN